MRSSRPTILTLAVITLLQLVGCRSNTSDNTASDVAPAHPVASAPFEAAPQSRTIACFLENVQFAPNSAELSPEAVKVLEKLLVYLEHEKDEVVVGPQGSSTLSTNLIVEGHADKTENVALHMRLGWDRAMAVSTWLLEHGFPQRKMRVVNFAATMPAAPSATEKYRQINRRVSFGFEYSEEKL